MLLEGIGFYKRPFRQQTHTQRIMGRRTELVALINKRTSMDCIAKHFGVSKSLIKLVMRELGLRSKNGTGCISQWVRHKEKLLDMLRKGRSRGEIAREFGVTRNVIIGACYRLGLSADAQVQDQLVLQRQAAQKIAARRHRNRQLRAAARFTKGLQTKKATRMKPTLSPWRWHMRAKASPPDSATRRTLMELGFGHCRYPIDDLDAPPGGFYCGAQTETETSSWCPYHAQFVFQNRMSSDVGGSLAAASRTGVESQCSPANATRPHQIQEAA